VEGGLGGFEEGGEKGEAVGSAIRSGKRVAEDDATDCEEGLERVNSSDCDFGRSIKGGRKKERFLWV
jgi:hypothetical protein